MLVMTRQWNSLETQRCALKLDSACVWCLFPQHAKSYKALLPYVASRSTQLAQEFAFFPTAPPHAQGGIFELRSYQLKPGVLLEWENTWCASDSPSCVVFRD